jgi:2'-5' RNA ligase
MTIDYAIALTFPIEVVDELDSLREEYNRYVSYLIEPHITLVYPFQPEVDIAIIKEKLEAVARRTKPFTLVLNGINYFEGGNNVAYVTIENMHPVRELHRSIVNSLSKSVKELPGYNFSEYIPHITIGEKIPEVILPIIKKKLANYRIHYECRIDYFSLFSEDNRVWSQKRVFKLSG